MRCFILLTFLWIQNMMGQVNFSDQTSLLNTTSFNSYQAVAVVDLNGDFLDDIVRMDKGVNMLVEYQQPNGSFFTESFVLTSNTWGNCAADVDNDGYNDFLFGGRYDSLKLMMSSGGGLASMKILEDSIFLQGINFSDIDNDALLDIYACHDEAPNLTYQNLGFGNFNLDPSLMNVHPFSGNYASVWSDFDDDGDADVYVSKCSVFAMSDPSDPRRINTFYQNNNGVFNEIAPVFAVNDSAQTWAADFADIDNDGRLELFVLNHSFQNRLYELNAAGTAYNDIIVGSGLPVSAAGNFQSVFRDFDNDGWVDLLIGGPDFGVYHNNGDGTFTLIPSPFPDTNTIYNYAVGDLNRDGFLDIYASYGFYNSNPMFTPTDKLLFNTTNSNNFVTFDLVGIQSNYNGIGAKLKLYGNWGVQIREVRSGESYGIMNSLSAHFGLGNETVIDSLVIDWSSGIHQKIVNPTINEFHLITESFSSCSNLGFHFLNTTDDYVSGANFYHETDGVIIANNMVNGGANITYDAKEYISLRNGFTAVAGSDFLAIIDGCTFPKSSNFLPQTNNFFTNSVVSISPNPTNNWLNIQFSPEKTGFYTVLVVDMYGKVVKNVFEGKVLVESGIIRQVSVEKLVSGVYEVVIFGESGEVFSKMVVVE